MLPFFYSGYPRKGGIALFLFRVKNGDSYQIVPPDLLPKSSLSKYRGGVAFFLLREKYIDWERETEGEWRIDRFTLWRFLTLTLILYIAQVKMILCPRIKAEKFFFLIFLLFFRVVGHTASLVSRVSPVSNKYFLGRRQSGAQTFFGNFAKLLFSRHILQITGSISEMGEMSWKIVLCLLLAWILVYLCLVKGVKSSGKVRYRMKAKDKQRHENRHINGHGYR